MAIWQGLNVNTGQTELPKYVETGIVGAMYTAALTTALANGDTIIGPVVPAGVFLTDVKVDVSGLDSNGSATLAFEVGTQTTPAQFIAAGNTTGRAGGLVSSNVPGTLGTMFAVATPIVATITAAAATPVAGHFTIYVTYTASP